MVDDAVVDGKVGRPLYWVCWTSTALGSMRSYPLFSTVIEGLSDESVHIGAVMVVTRTNIEFHDGILRVYHSLDTLMSL